MLLGRVRRTNLVECDCMSSVMVCFVGDDQYGMYILRNL